MEEINQIRKAKQEDLKNIINLLNQLSPTSNENKETNLEFLNLILQKITNNENYFLCAFESNNKLLGTGMLLIQMNLSHQGRPYGHIENVVVDKQQQGKGIGKKIINHLIEIAKQKNCYKVILNCEKHNIPFYEKSGMKETGEVEMRLDFILNESKV